MFNITFYLRRLHSLVGLFMGAFLVMHIGNNSAVLLGPDMMNTVIEALDKIPVYIRLPMELALVAAPFGFHALYGIYIALQANNNPIRYGYLQNWQFALQRWTAWYLVVFLAWHVYYMAIHTRITGIQLCFEFLQSYLSNPVYWVLYVLGMWAAIFHFTNGINTFCMTWGITKGPRIQMVINMACMGLCGALCLETLALMLMYILPIF